MCGDAPSSPRELKVLEEKKEKEKKRKEKNPQYLMAQHRRISNWKGNRKSPNTQRNN